MILVSGVSKSGKTHTLCQAVRIEPALRCIKASAILREIGRPVADLKPGDVHANQRALLEALEVLPHRSPLDLLDGHGLIETSEGPLLLSDEVFDRMRLRGIIMIVDRPDLIALRRKGGNLETSPKDIETIQTLELEHCERQSRRLGIPFRVTPSGMSHRLCATILEVVRTEENNSEGR